MHTYGAVISNMLLISNMLVNSNMFINMLNISDVFINMLNISDMSSATRCSSATCCPSSSYKLNSDTEVGGWESEVRIARHGPISALNSPAAPPAAKPPSSG